MDILKAVQSIDLSSAPLAKTQSQHREGDTWFTTHDARCVQVQGKLRNYQVRLVLKSYTTYIHDDDAEEDCQSMEETSLVLEALLLGTSIDATQYVTLDAVSDYRELLLEMNAHYKELVSDTLHTLQKEMIESVVAILDEDCTNRI